MAKTRIVEPLGDRVLVEVIPEAEVSAGGVIIPDGARERSQRGRVVAVGPGRLIADGTEFAKVPLEPEQVVLFSKYAGTELPALDGITGGPTLLVMREGDVLGIEAWREETEEEARDRISRLSGPQLADALVHAGYDPDSDALGEPEGELKLLLEEAQERQRAMREQQEAAAAADAGSELGLSDPGAADPEEPFDVDTPFGASDTADAQEDQAREEVEWSEGHEVKHVDDETGRELPGADPGIEVGGTTHAPPGEQTLPNGRTWSEHARRASEPEGRDTGLHRDSQG